MLGSGSPYPQVGFWLPVTPGTHPFLVRHWCIPGHHKMTRMDHGGKGSRLPYPKGGFWHLHPHGPHSVLQSGGMGSPSYHETCVMKCSLCVPGHHKVTCMDHRGECPGLPYPHSGFQLLHLLGPHAVLPVGGMGFPCHYLMCGMRCSFHFPQLFNDHLSKGLIMVVVWGCAPSLALPAFPVHVPFP